MTRMPTASAVLAALAVGAPLAAQAQAAADCPVPQANLADALRKAVKPNGGPSNGGFDNNMWASVVRRDGTVCAVAYSGGRWDEQWLGSRVIAAQKAHTASAFSLRTTAISTANLYTGSQPGGFLYGIASGNPPAPEAAYAGDAA